MNAKVGHINKIEIVGMIEKGKRLFSDDLNGFIWDHIPSFSVLTGKNGFGKSKILKLIRYRLNDTGIKKNVILNGNENRLSFDDLHVELIHFDDNIMDLRDMPFYRNTNSKFLEFNFASENNANDSEEGRVKSRFSNINDLLNLVFENNKNDQLNEDLKKYAIEYEICKDKDYSLLKSNDGRKLKNSEAGKLEKAYFINFLCEYKNITKPGLNVEKLKEYTNRRINEPCERHRELVNTVIDKFKFPYEFTNDRSFKRNEDTKQYDEFNFEDQIKLFNIFWITENIVINQEKEPNLDTFVNELEKGINKEDIEFINERITCDDFKYKIVLQDQICFKYKKDTLMLTELTVGQKILLMSFLWKYAAESLKGKPVILLDEPDGFLHASSIKTFIDNIKRFIKENNGQVILTTHNAVTISLIEDESLFLLQHNPRTNKKEILERGKTNRTRVFEAINDRLFFIREPSKLVFIEGEGDDYKFYTYFYNKIAASHPDHMQIIFRSLGSNKLENFFNTSQQEAEGGCNRDYYEYIYGIVDGDAFINREKAFEFNAHIVPDEELNGWIKKLPAGDANKRKKKDLERKQLIEDCATRKDSLLKNVSRLQRRNLENYIYDPINMFFITKKLLFELKAQDALSKKTTSFRENRRKVFGEDCAELEDNTVFDYSKEQLQNIVNCVVSEKAYENYTKVTSTDNVTILKDFTLLEENKEIELEYPSFLLYADGNQFIRTLFSKLELQQAFQTIKIETKKNENKCIMEFVERTKCNLIFTKDLRDIFHCFIGHQNC